MKTISLIANSGIQFCTARININKDDSFCKYFYEWVNPVNKRCSVEAVYKLEEKNPDDDTTTIAYFYLRPLVENGWLAPDQPISISLLKSNGINPVAIEGEEQENGKIYKIDFGQAKETLSKFENKWLPIPYFYQRKKQNGDVIYRKSGPLNWSRFKMIPQGENDGTVAYDIVLAFETRAKDKTNLGVVEQKNNENPFFDNETVNEIDFGLCKNELLLLDFCSQQLGSSYIHDYLFNLVFPGRIDVAHLADEDIHRYTFVTAYLYLINLMAEKEMLPNVKLYRSKMEDARPVDMVINLGNAKTTALLVENGDLNSVVPLQLMDFSNPVKSNDESVELQKNDDSFDMRMVFRTELFGNCGPNKSRQFVYPSFVRLGKESQELMNASFARKENAASLFSYASSKRFLWDSQPSEEEWKNVVLAGESGDNTIPEIPNLSRFVSNTGELSVGGIGNQSCRFSRRSLNTFAFLEMINQANIQINSDEYRSRFGNDKLLCPRLLKNIIVTCPPAMLKAERDALQNCVADAATLFGKFFELRDAKITVIPQAQKRNNDKNSWCYDEGTCTQLVYMYSQVAYKYKGCGSEFFKLYQQNKDLPLTIGSVDVGAGTIDMLINEYAYEENEDLFKITPNPLFYDTFNKGCDDVVKRMIAKLVFEDENSVLRKQLGDLSIDLYRQFINDFFGKNANPLVDKNLSKNFTILYAVPMMNYFLELMSKNSCDCVVKYSDVFASNQLSEELISEFKSSVNVWLQNKGEKTCDVDLSKLELRFVAKQVSEIVFSEFEPLLKKVATLMHAYSCDVILLNGLPASLSPIRDIFLKYYAISPDRLIVLDKYYVGSWYPFAQNTGYITNSQTIIPVGALIANYASAPQVMNHFSVDTEKLGKELISSKTVQFVEGKKIGTKVNYLMTPFIKQGSVEVKQFPATLNAKQLDLESYPTRAIYLIDVNETKIVEKVRRQSIANGVMAPTNEWIASEVEKSKKELQDKMPLTVMVERNCMDKDSLIVSAIKDKDGADLELTDCNIEIQFKNFGVEDPNWLDSGIIEF